MAGGPEDGGCAACGAREVNSARANESRSDPLPHRGLFVGARGVLPSVLKGGRLNRKTNSYSNLRAFTGSSRAAK
jgi:hypothetical protein